MISYLFRLLPDASIEDGEQELLNLGLEHIYCIEDDLSGDTLIGGLSKKKLKTDRLEFLILSEEKESEGIDWQSQWSQFAEDFRDGISHIDLSRFGGSSTLLLSPGPGFGDLSHPTTYLMLELMQGRIAGEPIIDIGCGSGILSLAALKLGATSALGIDIDQEALEHARRNCALNHLFAQFSLHIPATHPQGNILLMNMIFPEQQIVMKEKTQLNSLAKFWIVSGILAEQKEDYLHQAKKWGWNLTEEKERSGWLGLVFTLYSDLN